MAAIETTLHRIMRVNDLIDVFITPSEFLRNKLIEYGFREDRIVCLNNFNNVDLSDEETETGDYYLYVGRISEEKGIKTLIDAAIKANAGKLKIIGDGPLKEEMIAYAKSMNGESRIEFLGHKSHEEVIEYLKRCQFVVLPSEWYENYPYAVIEAFSCGKSVVGSKIGGIPELVRDTERGLIFEPEDSDDLGLTIKYLLKNQDIALEMGENAKTFANKILSSEKFYEKLIQVYLSALKRSRKQKKR
jgi:glycosyltransferase involved in cell wall biosynthesis